MLKKKKAHKPSPKQRKLQQPESISPRVYYNFMVNVCPTDPELFGSCREENHPAWVSSRACHSIKLAIRPRFQEHFFVWALILLLLSTNNANLHCLSVTAQKSSNSVLRNAHVDTEQRLMPHSRAQSYSLREAHLLVLSFLESQHVL